MDITTSRSQLIKHFDKWVDINGADVVLRMLKVLLLSNQESHKSYLPVLLSVKMDELQRCYETPGHGSPHCIT